MKNGYKIKIILYKWFLKICMELLTDNYDIWSSLYKNDTDPKNHKNI